MKVFKNNSGSSLIIAVLLIGVVSVVSFGVSSLTLNDMKLHKLFVGSGESYYAAESALEEAMFELKNNRDYSGIVGNTSDAIKRKYEVTYYGDYFYISKLLKDDFVEIKLGDNYSSSDTSKSTSVCVITGGWGSGSTKILAIKQLKDIEYTPTIYISPVQDTYNYGISFNNPDKIIIQALGAEVNNLYVKAVKDYLNDCKLSEIEKPTNKKHDIDTGYLTIKATGYYQNLNRQLQAKIDRKSGALLNIFDFTLYSEGNID